MFGYDEFGSQFSTKSCAIKQPFGYTGYSQDPISDTLFAQARQYDPKVGRFVSQDMHWNPENMTYGNSPQSITLKTLIPDPLVIAQANNLYAYTVNNPLRYTDPTGFNCENSEDEGYTDLEVWLVHGTFGGPEHYSNEFIEFLMRELNISRSNIHLPDWGGRLSGTARWVGGIGLAHEINSRHSETDTNILVVSYSHGGNVSRNALNRLYSHYDFDLSNTVLVGAGVPIRTDYRLRSGVRDNLGLHINIFNEFDSVQLLGTMHLNPFSGQEGCRGQDRDTCVPGRSVRSAVNINATFDIPRGRTDNFGGTPAHGAMHSNIELWRHYSILDYIISVFE